MYCSFLFYRNSKLRKNFLFRSHGPNNKTVKAGRKEINKIQLYYTFATLVCFKKILFYCIQRKH